jgi:hypothetical protein
VPFAVQRGRIDSLNVDSNANTFGSGNGGSAAVPVCERESDASLAYCAATDASQRGSLGAAAKLDRDVIAGEPANRASGRDSRRAPLGVRPGASGAGKIVHRCQGNGDGCSD